VLAKSQCAWAESVSINVHQGPEPIRYSNCNTPGVDHQLGSGFKLKHDKLSGDDNVKVNLWR
jgi:hypothetical protein